MIKIEHQAL